mmetsp:Transcript_254/g.598  ORF Transcript_254/g.598 Transcript_254/m.598 type:complete len:193 (+) Transcript_254:2-580(+)
MVGRSGLVLALLVVLLASESAADCCNQKCRSEKPTAVGCDGGQEEHEDRYAPTREEAGCGNERQLDCYCAWNYRGPKTALNGCVPWSDQYFEDTTPDDKEWTKLMPPRGHAPRSQFRLHGERNVLWDCKTAVDYQTNGRCEDYAAPSRAPAGSGQGIYKSRGGGLRLARLKKRALLIKAQKAKRKQAALLHA